MRFLHRLVGCSLKDRVRSSVIQEELATAHPHRKGICFGCLLDTSLWRCSRHVPESGHAGGPPALDWPGNALGELFNMVIRLYFLSIKFLHSAVLDDLECSDGLSKTPVTQRLKVMSQNMHFSYSLSHLNPQMQEAKHETSMLFGFLRSFLQIKLPSQQPKKYRQELELELRGLIFP